MEIIRNVRLKYKVYDSFGNLMRVFHSYQAASEYKFVYGNYSWIIKH